ncbi:hypothetical protein O181_071687 [Austropuccinia psidii MF-1]|uniref:non-specific serine/threonine protein kinase n=1 Tax=Austropuccinia psidii MF-1 TaxID=1389203 RepID=A0A9Q3I9E9_9BASI|nr:hypothetical protein [Austropuccinia psidii MF-1]
MCATWENLNDLRLTCSRSSKRAAFLSGIPINFSHLISHIISQSLKIIVACEIYLGLDLNTNQEVAIKVEPLETLDPQLRNEAKVYCLLNGKTGFPLFKWIGSGSHYNALVIELLGVSLDQQFARREHLHDIGFIHRDIKPGNFLMGRGSKSKTVHLIDFGLSYRYRRRIDDRKEEHVGYEEGQGLVGTACYSSICTHLGIRQTRRDDLESLGYMLISFLKGTLPWIGIKSESRDSKHSIMSEIKIKTSLHDLCLGLPIEFLTYLRYIRSLRFQDRPDYSYLRRLFRDVFIKKGFKEDYIFDWS